MLEHARTRLCKRCRCVLEVYMITAATTGAWEARFRELPRHGNQGSSLVHARSRVFQFFRLPPACIAYIYHDLMTVEEPLVRVFIPLGYSGPVGIDAGCSSVAAYHQWHSVQNTVDLYIDTIDRSSASSGKPHSATTVTWKDSQRGAEFCTEAKTSAKNNSLLSLCNGIAAESPQGLPPKRAREHQPSNPELGPSESPTVILHGRALATWNGTCTIIPCGVMLSSPTSVGGHGWEGAEDQRPGGSIPTPPTTDSQEAKRAQAPQHKVVGAAKLQVGCTLSEYVCRRGLP